MTTSLDPVRPRPTPIPTVPTQRAIRPPQPFVFDHDDDPEPTRAPRWVSWVLLPLALLVSIGTVLALVAVGAVQFADSTNRQVDQVTDPNRIDAIPPSQPTAAVPDGDGGEGAYLTALRGSGLTKYGPDADLVALGHNVCEGYPSGLSYGDMVRALTEAGYSIDDAQAQVAIATAAFCPTFGDSIPAESGGA